MTKTLSRTRDFTISSVIGSVLTLLLLTSSDIADEHGYHNLARLLFWHNEILQNLIPLHNIGTLEKPFYEGTPLNVLAFFASIPLEFVIYGVAAYGALRLIQNKMDSSQK